MDEQMWNIAKVISRSLSLYFLINNPQEKCCFCIDDFSRQCYKTFFGGNIKKYIQRIHTHLQGKYHCTADLLFGWFGFDPASKSVIILHNQSSWIQTCKRGGQPYSDTSLVSEYSLLYLPLNSNNKNRQFWKQQTD